MGAPAVGVAAASGAGTAAAGAGTAAALTWASIATTALATGAQAYQANRAAQFERAVAQRNATVARLAAEREEAIGAREAGRALDAARRLEGSQRVSFFAMGVDPYEGTALDVLAGSRLVGEQEAADLRYGAASRAWGLTDEAMQQDWRGRAWGQRAKTATGVGALTTAASTFSVGYDLNWGRR